MSIHLVKADIFTTGAKYIAHQVNVSTKGQATGIAKIIFERYPYADIYKDRIEDDVPGKIDIAGDGLFYRGIINMLAQYYPGKGQTDPSKFDCYSDRKRWFYECLMAIADIPNLHSIAFPYGISCGLAGGDWNWYEQKLNKFAEYVEKKCNAEVILYKMD